MDWHYSLQDFMLFSPEVYWRLVASYTEKSFYVLLFFNLVLVMLLFTRRIKVTFIGVFLLLALCWVWIGWQFYFTAYATINWSAKYLGATCIICAGLFLSEAFRAYRAGVYGHVSFARLVMVYFVVVRPAAFYFISDNFLLSAPGILPVSTGLLSVGLMLSVSRSVIWLTLVPLLFLLAIETITLYLLDSALWLETLVTVVCVCSVRLCYRTLASQSQASIP